MQRPCAFYVVCSLSALARRAQLIHRLESGLHPHVSQDQGFLQIVIKFIVQLSQKPWKIPMLP